MSALPPIADMCGANWDVRYGPKADTKWPIPMRNGELLLTSIVGSGVEPGGFEVPLYHLVLKTRHDHFPDRDGSEWPNEAAAREEAILVAHDLMRNQEVKTQAWRIEVCDEDLRPCSELLFAELDERIAHWPHELRDPYIVTSRRMAALSDAILALRGTLAELSETLSHADTVMAAIAGK